MTPRFTNRLQSKEKKVKWFYCPIILLFYGSIVTWFFSPCTIELVHSSINNPAIKQCNNLVILQSNNKAMCQCSNIAM